MKLFDWEIWLKNKKECERQNKIYLEKSILKRQNINPKRYLDKSLHNLDFANWIYQKHKDGEIAKIFGNQRFFD